MSTLNKQPIFTATPILVSETFDPYRYTANLYDVYSYADEPSGRFVFSATDIHGTLIERITITTCASNDYPNISERYVYMFLHSPGANIRWNLYKTAYIAADTISYPKLNPVIEWVFEGGLLLPNEAQIAFGASENVDHSGYQGDYLSVTIEGSSYTQP